MRDNADFILSHNFYLLLSVESLIPKAYSAVSSKSDLPQAGPYPSAFLEKGLYPATPLHTDEHPEELAVTSRSPNN